MTKVEMKEGAVEKLTKRVELVETEGINVLENLLIYVERSELFGKNHEYDGKDRMAAAVTEMRKATEKFKDALKHYEGI